MGYTTEFTGSFKVDRPVDDATFELMVGLASTRRMMRKLGPEFGVDGEFFVGSRENYGQNESKDIVDYNKPPRTQPSLWCQWLMAEDRQTIEWDGGEKFYSYIEWIEYIIAKVLEPRGYKLSGAVGWRGETYSDAGIIAIQDNVVRIGKAEVSFSF